MTTDLHQLSDDLRFVRHAVEARGKVIPAEARITYAYWALYVLVGYFLIDVAPNWAAQVFFAAGGFLGGLASWAMGKHLAKKYGQVSRTDNRRSALHWAGGMIFAVIGCGLLAMVIPALRGPAGSQVLLVMIGLVYFFWGVYFDRNFLWLGPVLMICGIAVGFIPYYPWTCVGAVIALGLVVPTFFPRVASQPTVESA